MSPTTLDLWQIEREKAETLPSGCRMQLTESYAGKAILRLWKPKAIKPYANYSFKTKEDAYKYAYEQDERITNHQKLVAERKAARKGSPEMIDAVKVGDIFHHSWGWEQTNADFYQVIAKNGRHVTVREIKDRWADNNRQGMSSMSADVVPVPDAFKDNAEPVTKLLQFSDGKPYITMSSYGFCDLWDGRPVYTSWYA